MPSTQAPDDNADGRTPARGGFAELPVKQVAAEFDARADRYDENEFHQWLAAQVSGRLPGGPLNILDVGAGSGLASAQSHPGATTVLADVSLNMLRTARRRGRSSMLVRADAHHLPIGADTMDLVICVAVDSFLDVETFIVQAMRVLRPGGSLAMTLWADTPSEPRVVADRARAFFDANGLALVAQETLEWEGDDPREHRRCILVSASK